MKKTTNATFRTDKEESARIHGGDGAYLQVLLGSLIGVSSVHFCLICSVRYTSFSHILSYSSEDGHQEWSSCANFVHLNALRLCPTNFELQITTC